ncbi:signal recognition particle protein [Ehrlichia chaffeensis str. Liberty]|nr:signal recognition particle protein [Ehrlichia chaffeensis str. Jax]AHX06699.1 signal recognition particle protein [Ehrlichia chaffeensis str. Liberty]AHX09778.1 signal recognition particle protein [Ehrlichia chaffeensis str. Wakulla]
MQSKHVISSEDFDAAMEEVKVALLEADVSLAVVKDFISNVKEKIVGGTTVKGVLPTQMIIKKIQDCLIEVLGSEKCELDISKPLSVIMMVGLQGVGKTTTTAKLALKLKNKKKEVVMASLDVYRPAAQKQLEILGKQIDVQTLPIIENQAPIDIVKRAMDNAQQANCDVLILDTAGRLHVDQVMMEELRAIKDLTSPSEVILVVDSMIGQDAINVAKSFNDNIGITGIILTRIDGDSRGGAALSMKMSVGSPIKFIANGEKLSDLDDFYPERIAKRILNMGDVVSLVEKATEAVGKHAIDEMQKKAQKGKFDLNDLVQQLKALNKLGGIANILKFMPNFGADVKRQVSGIANDSRVKQYIAIVNSMTKKERENPKILNGARKARIAKGSGVHVNVINMLIKQFNQMSSLMNKFSKVDYSKIKNTDFMNMFNKE